MGKRGPLTTCQHLRSSSYAAPRKISPPCEYPRGSSSGLGSWPPPFPAQTTTSRLSNAAGHHPKPPGNPKIHLSIPFSLLNPNLTLDSPKSKYSTKPSRSALDRTKTPPPISLKFPSKQSRLKLCHSPLPLKP
ncbi:hypothetical protein CCACVL1_20029 [Corchorus capsularis]|uniref:Uncharacterized protein n=1 Tax=Corchorus capsularis TaxID=210143 RepID=A0A1R3HDA5_COCAP|nr:hypothetical protein CCACVL1_20029 [Corchorus capsularis]